MGADHLSQPSPGVYFWPYPVFEAVRYGEIQRDTARYVRIQLDIVRYSGKQWTCCKIDRYRIHTGIDARDTKDMVRYRRDSGKIQAGHPKNTRQGGVSLHCRHQAQPSKMCTPVQEGVYMLEKKACLHLETELFVSETAVFRYEYHSPPR